MQLESLALGYQHTNISRIFVDLNGAMKNHDNITEAEGTLTVKLLDEIVTYQSLFGFNRGLMPYGQVNQNMLCSFAL